jgi:hypothetical protein
MATGTVNWFTTKLRIHRTGITQQGRARNSTTRDGQTWPQAARRRPRWQSSPVKAGSASVGWTSRRRRTRASRRRPKTQTGPATRWTKRPASPPRHVPGSLISNLSLGRSRTPDRTSRTRGRRLPRREVSDRGELCWRSWNAVVIEPPRGAPASNEETGEQHANPN